MVTEDGETEASPRPPTADTEAFLRWLEKVPDPVRRYSLATSELQKHQETVQRLSSLRAEALADASEEDSLSALARRLGVSRQRAHQLVTESKNKGKKPAAQQGAPPRRRKEKGNQ